MKNWTERLQAALPHATFPQFFQRYASDVLWHFVGSNKKNDQECYEILLAIILNDEVLDKTQVNNYYYEREWRSIYPWKFSKDDVAIIIMPRQKIKAFIEIRKSAQNININDESPILPFDMIHAM